MQVERDPATTAKRLNEDPLPLSKGALIGEFVDAIIGNRDISEETQADFDVASICFASDTSLRNEAEQEVQYV